MTDSRSSRHNGNDRHSPHRSDSSSLDQKAPHRRKVTFEPTVKITDIEIEAMEPDEEKIWQNIQSQLSKWEGINRISRRPEPGWEPPCPLEDIPKNLEAARKGKDDFVRAQKKPQVRPVTSYLLLDEMEAVQATRGKKLVDQEKKGRRKRREEMLEAYSNIGSGS